MLKQHMAFANKTKKANFKTPTQYSLSSWITQHYNIVVQVHVLATLAT